MVIAMTREPELIEMVDPDTGEVFEVPWPVFDLYTPNGRRLFSKYYSEVCRNHRVLIEFDRSLLASWGAPSWFVPCPPRASASPMAQRALAAALDSKPRYHSRGRSSAPAASSRRSMSSLIDIGKKGRSP